MDAFSAGHNAKLFITPQIVTFDGSTLPSCAEVVIGPRLIGAKRGLAPTPGQSSSRFGSKQPRMHLAIPANGIPGRGRVPTVQQPLPIPGVGRPAPATPYICVSDFMLKLDGTRIPAGCSTPSCPRRHIPLPPVGQFAAGDKAEILQSLQKMKGTRVPSMVALVQARA